MGSLGRRVASFSSKAHTLSELMYAELTTVTTSLVTASSAPNTLKRCLPEGALIQTRVKHHTTDMKAPRTKCAASTKNTARWPCSA